VYDDIKPDHVGFFSAVKGGSRRVCVTDWGAVRALRDGETPEAATDSLCTKLFNEPDDD
jgi:hypothetical protein